MFGVTGKIKKLGIMAVLSALMSVALVACGGEASSTSSPDAAAANTPAANAPADSGTTSDAITTSGDVQEVAVTLSDGVIANRSSM